MTLAQPIKRFTPEEYYRLEREAEYKSDYYDGEIFAMSGGTSRHSLIIMNIGGELRQRLKGKPCTAYESSQRLKVQATGLRCYPDVSVYCEEPIYDTEDPFRETAINPSVLFEVLSKRTEGYDRGFKSESYRRIDKLNAYVLVSQWAPHVELFERRAGGSWSLREVNGMDAKVEIPSIDVELPMSEIYYRVKFPPSPFPQQGEEGE